MTFGCDDKFSMATLLYVTVGNKFCNVARGGEYGIGEFAEVWVALSVNYK